MEEQTNSSNKGTHIEQKNEKKLRQNNKEKQNGPKKHVYNLMHKNIAVDIGMSSYVHVHCRP